jgi:ring-1,2-phenylacetyl-CoA epoxidase subunit PaaC
MDGLSAYLLAMADDELVLGQRAAEWCGQAPLLEEDIAFANLALDEIGHAAVWYALLAERIGADTATYPDQLVYFRSPGNFRCLQLVELPKGDWAFSMLRQFFFDSLETVRLAQLEGSLFQPLADAAAKIRREELYHLRHSSAWIKRLALGTTESRARLQAALEAQWPYIAQLFGPQPGDARLAEQGLIPASQTICAAWSALVAETFAKCKLDLPPEQICAGKKNIPDRNQHTPHLEPLVAEMQSVARQEPQARW